MPKNRSIYFYISLFFYLSSTSYAQMVNQWINYSQQYYKILIDQEGVYQLTYDDLANAQIQLASIDARTFKLYHRGEEIAILFNGQSDGRFDPGDDIQFIAKANDGTSDTYLYDEPISQPHTLYNLFSDKSAYFLTWSLDGSQGKRMNRINPINNSAGLPAESSLLANVQNVFVNTDSRGKPYAPNNEVRKSAFNLGEGFSGSVFSGTSNIILSGIEKQVRTDDNLNFEILIQGRNNRSHSVEVLVGPNTGSLRSIGFSNFEGFEFIKIAQEIDWSDVNVNGDLVVRVNASASSNDNVSVSYLNLQYNRSFDMDNAVNSRLQLRANTANTSFVSFTNVNSSAKVYRIDDFNSPQLLETSRVGNTLSTVIQNTSSGAKLYFQNQALLDAELNKVNFRDYSDENPNYVIISHRDLNQSIGNYSAVIKDYGGYRASSAGGNYDTMVVFMDELFDQFNYGEYSPASIYRFSDYLVNNTKAEYVFLIGKGLNWFNRPYRKSPAANEFEEYVPSAGYPGADNLFGYELEAPQTFSLSYGRLNAHNAQNVADYLDKIKEMEASAIDDLRRKAFLNLSGGLTEFEIATFNNYIQQFSQKVKSPYIGGSSEQITKQTTQVVERINIAEQVNQGLAMITFFGHSGTSSADIDIGFVSNPDFGYQNKGKYPLIYVNGCNAGSIYELPTSAVSFGEDWINTPELGATHVLAHTAEGFPSELKRYADIFYQTAFGDSAFIDEPVGKIQLKTANEYLSQFGDNPAEIYVSQAQQFNLMGDPGYRLFPTNMPDFDTSDVDVSIISLDGAPIDALTNEFAFDIIVRNYGITTDDSLAITVNRRLPNNEIIRLDTQYYASPYFLDTLRYTVENNQLGEFGDNNFEIIIDAGNSIQELNELNNSVNFNYFLSLGTTINLYPYNASLVNNNQVQLTTQSVNLLSKERDYLFEIDTTATFNSSFLKSGRVTAKVVATWSVGILNKTNQTYYWRTRFAEVAEGELADWTNSYFVYNPGFTKGWAQNSQNEFIKNEYTGLEIADNNWSFFQRTIPFSVTSTAEDGSTPFRLSIAGDEYITTAGSRGLCRRGSVNLVAFDQVTGAPYLVLSSGGLFDLDDPLSCGRRPQLINQIFNTNLNDPTTYFQKYYNELAAGDFVLLTSYDSTAWQVLVGNNRAELLDLGATSTVIDGLRNGNPYILLGRKGAGEGNGIERYSFEQPEDDPSTQLFVELNDAININFTTGIMTSTVIGPAKEWTSIDAYFLDQDSEDQIRVDVFGVDTSNIQTLLLSDVSLPVVIDDIDAALYPFLRLRTILTDSTNFTPPRIEQWQVNYLELPDAVIIPNQSIETEPVQVAEGLNYPINFKVVNVTPTSFEDSLAYRVNLFNQNSRINKAEIDKLPPLESNASFEFSVDLNSRNNVGLNDFSILINPTNRFNEYRKINNQISLFNLLNVKKDSLPPFIDITFDGINIMDGDIVAPSPLIKIVLRDENKILLKSDTANINLSIQPLCEGCELRPIYFSNKNVNYTPATAEEPFTITYQANKFEDGQYKIKANIADESNNKAGEEPYEVSFEVVNASTITNFFPYPNPFSSQARFVFTLTGSEIPDELKIQILTVSGRVVREILQDEIGLIHIGNNITDYAWDGTDEFGDKLANGVYLYRVLVRKNGMFLDQRETSADKAFKKGYGKLYILR